jgi:PIN domain nuclease of toxin-antitoxin system
MLDTHAAVFLWEGRTEVFGLRSIALLERAELLVSSLVRLELTLLREVGKVTVAPEMLLGGLVAEFGVTLSREPLEALVPHAAPLSWTRDPFDRLLVAASLLHDAPLITRDRRIQENYPRAVW